MRLSTILAIAAGTIVVASPVIDSVGPGSSTISSCDANCVHRILFRSSYASAAKSFRMVFGLCDAYKFCLASDWCGDAINSTLTKVASQAKTDITTGIDFNNMTNLTLLSTISTLTARSTRMAISLAQALLKNSPVQCPSKRIADLEKLRWLMTQQESPINYDSNAFDQIIADLESPAFNKSLVRRDKDKDDELKDGLTGGLSSLAGAGLGLASMWKQDSVLYRAWRYFRNLFRSAPKVLPEENILRSMVEEEPMRETFSDFVKAGRADYITSGADPNAPEEILEDAIAAEEYLDYEDWYTDNGVEKIEKWLDNVPNDIEPVPEDTLPAIGEPDYPFYPPGPDNLPLGADHENYPHSDGPPAEYQTPKPPIKKPPQVASPEASDDSVYDEDDSNASEPAEASDDSVYDEDETNASEPGTPPAQAVELFLAETYHPITGQMRQVTVRATGDGVTNEAGAQQYDVLDSAGNFVNTIWRDPATLSRMPGEWMAFGEQFVRQQFNQAAGRMEPVLNSIGEPLVASGAGVLNNLAPVAVDAAEAGTDAAVGGLVGAAGVIFTMFLPEGGQPKQSKVVFHPVNGTIVVRDSDDTTEGREDLPNTTPAQTKTQNTHTTDETHTTLTTSASRMSRKTQQDTPSDFLSTSRPNNQVSPVPIRRLNALTEAPRLETSTTITTSTRLMTSVITSVYRVKEKMSTTMTTSTLLTTSIATSTLLKTSIVTSTTLATVKTGAAATTLPTVNDTRLTNIEGCTDLADCPYCTHETFCQINDLPTECVIGASEIDALPSKSSLTWDSCVVKISALDRWEAKAWARSIFRDPNCVSKNDWEPLDLSLKKNECWDDLQGEHFLSVQSTYLDGLLPSSCPGAGLVSGNPDDVDEDLMQNCKAVADILFKPFHGHL